MDIEWVSSTKAADIPAYRIGRVIRLQRADIDDFIERSRITPTAGE